MRGLKLCDGMVKRVNPNQTALSGDRISGQFRPFDQVYRVHTHTSLCITQGFFKNFQKTTLQVSKTTN